MPSIHYILGSVNLSLNDKTYFSRYIATCSHCLQSDFFVIMSLQGTDPAADLYKFAEEMKFHKKLSSISLGQGQVSKLYV